MPDYDSRMPTIYKRDGMWRVAWQNHKRPWSFYDFEAACLHARLIHPRPVR